MSCFSFHPVKPITTGEGGMVTTNDEGLAERLRQFRTHGIVRMPERGGWFYEISEVGYNYRMTDIQAALGLAQMAKLDRFIERRNEIAEWYRHELAELPVGLPPAAPTGFRHGYHLLAVRVPERDRVFQELRDVGIGVQVHYVPVHHHPVSADIGMKPGDLPVCDEVYSELVSLPMWPGLMDSDFEAAVSELRKCLPG
jgi:dTDP-4-amino-4,6-dideoxygalactose transaminase